MKPSILNCTLVVFSLCSLWACESSNAVSDSPTATRHVQGTDFDIDRSVSSPIPADCQQLIVVMADSWDSPRAQFCLVDKVGEQWSSALRAQATIGRNGSAWGLGVHSNPKDEKVKREGDGRSPAGVFRLGRCMGYADQPPYKSSWPYLPLTDFHIGVDDPESAFYNQVIDRTEVSKKASRSLRSFETMRRSDTLYRWLFEIRHNPKNIAGEGSLIFLHLWQDPNTTTSGCTAIAEDTMAIVLRWIQPKKKPLLIHLPRATYDKMQRGWGLPSLP